MRAKKERTLVMALGGILLASGLLIYFKGDKIYESLRGGKYTGTITKTFARRELENRIDRKIESKSLGRLIESLSLEKLDLADEILQDKDLVNFLNEGHLEIGGKKINYEEAVAQEKIKKGLQDLGVLSPELKGYLDKKYPTKTYVSIGKKIQIPEAIKTRDRLSRLIPEENLKNLILGLNDGKIEALNNIFIKNPEVVKALETKKIEDYTNIEKLYELSKSLYEIGQLEPRIALILNNIFPNFDFRKAALYGNLYLSDNTLEKNYMEEFQRGDYTIKHPLVKLNPYGRTPLTALVKFKTKEENPKVKVTVLGERGMENYSYISEYRDIEGVPIVGLYSRSKNKVILEVLNSKNIPVERGEVSIDTGYLSDLLPSIYVEKRVLGFTQPGMNLAVYNVKNEGMPFIFDSQGNIRYVLNTGNPIRTLTSLERSENGNWVVSNDEDNFIMDITGKILGRMGRTEPVEKPKNKEIQYLVRNNNVLTVVGFIDTPPHPYCLFSELGLDSKRPLFRAKIFYDYYKKEDNNIVKGERLPLYPGNNK